MNFETFHSFQVSAFSEIIDSHLFIYHFSLFVIWKWPNIF